MLNQTRFLPTLAGVAMGLLLPTQVMALTFDWSFVTEDGSTGGAGQTISGTISGLVEGSNDGTGLTVTVESTPTGELLGGGWVFDATANGGDAFTVTGGNVTFADALFERNGGLESLYFGGFGGYDPNLHDSDFDPDWFNFSDSNTFTPTDVDTPSTPEPGTALALMGLGLGALASRGKKQA